MTSKPPMIHNRLTNKNRPTTSIVSNISPIRNNFYQTHSTLSRFSPGNFNFNHNGGSFT